MHKTLIIIHREFSTRVRKKSFLVITILVPMLFILFYAFLIWIMTKEDSQERVIAVVNVSPVEQPLKQINNTRFEYLSHPLPEAEYIELLKRGAFYAVVSVPEKVLTEPEVTIFSLTQLPLELKNEIVSQVRREIEDVKRAEVIARSQLPNLEQELAAVRTPVSVRTLLLSGVGEAKERSAEVASIVGLLSGLIIYFFIFMYASQVMRGVIEEKSNRIIEVLISSVKPFQFLLGKIVGVAAVGLLQFLIWIAIGGVILTLSLAFMATPDIESLQSLNSMNMMGAPSGIQPEQAQLVQQLASQIDPGAILQFLAMFLFYFIGGYLLYASLFAAVGSAVDNDTDSQQFMAPLSIILVAALYIGIAAMRNPDTPLVFWSSLIPFTSPVVMLVRLPFGVPTWELITSMAILVASFLFFTWLSGKIYRIGILMYGKKASWKELFKWLRY